ncbi:MAG: peptide ABC transporter substrate-binding protein [Ruminococcus sp.]|nr:peptide ABC transporter substrate-binding protein [Ruminococcus sp.]
MRKRSFRHLSRLICAAAAIAMMMTGCGTVEKVLYTAPQAVFRQIYTSECSTLNYLKTSMYADTAVSANIIDCLVDYDNVGNILPGLAESWSSNDDMTEWTFNIRHGVKWVNSEGAEYAEVTADDWVAAAEYVNNAANNSSCRYMFSSGSVISGAQQYYDYTAYLRDSDRLTEDNDGEPVTVPPVTAPEDIGVKAVDKYTLKYQLEKPCPFFLSVLSYPAFMPVSRAYLAEKGDSFGSDNKHLLYNGAYILSTWLPLERRVMTKNLSYWDSDKVYIDRIVESYNPDLAGSQSSKYIMGEIDRAQLSTAELDEWMADEERCNMVHPARSDNAYSYFYCFNFDPQFNDRYEKDNWLLAVNNENFRKAVAAAMDKRTLVSVYDPYDPDRLISNTITPRDFVANGSTDYTMQEQFKGISGSRSEDAAKRFAADARKELESKGAVFPIKMLMPYNPAVLGWHAEADIIKRQIEETLGNDFVNVIVEAGPETNFLSEIRRSGNYAFMKCNWGADYTDPETFTKPFDESNDFNFWYRGDGETAALFAEWDSIRAEACGISSDKVARYSRFADAEKLLIDHAVAIPISVDCSGGYVVSKLDQYESEYSACGIALQRFKLMHLNDKSYGIEECEKRYKSWQEKRSEIR